MKKLLASLGALSLLLSFTAQAAPQSTFSAIAPIQYNDGVNIPSTDILGYTLWCGSSPNGPYLHFYDVPNLISGTLVDISSCVKGIPGTYYFVATATSSIYGTTSIDSLETNRTYTADELGKTPMAPTLLMVL